MIPSGFFSASQDIVGVAICNYPGVKLVPSHGVNIILGDRVRIVEGTERNT